MPIYVQIPGINGESTDNKYPNQFEVATVTWGLTNNGVVTSKTIQGKPVFSSITVTKIATLNSPFLMLRTAQVSNLGMVVITSTGTILGYGELPLNIITLNEAALASYSQSYEPGASPMEQLTFVFARIDYAQFTYDATGRGSKVEESWNLLSNNGM